MILTSQQLRAYFPVGAPFFAADVNYATPTIRWLLDVFYPWFWQFRTVLGLRVYERKNDCDNFARSAAQAAEDCHALTQDSASGDAEGLACGEFWYTKSTGERHAICAAVVDEGKLIFFEPQNGNPLQLTQEEIASCAFVRF